MNKLTYDVVRLAVFLAFTAFIINGDHSGWWVFLALIVAY